VYIFSWIAATLEVSMSKSETYTSMLLYLNKALSIFVRVEDNVV
jgi:hypothetical protein